jgi:hypothetical protein
MNAYQTHPGDPSVSGYTQITADLSGLSSGQYTLRFSEVNNQNYLNVGLDSVSIQATVASGGTGGTTDTGGQAPEPGTLILIGSGCVAFSLWRRRMKTAATAAA